MSIYRSPSADRQRNQRAINNYIGAEQYDPAAVVTTGQSATTCTHAEHHGKAGATYPRYKTLPWCLLAAGLGGWSSPAVPGVPPPATAFTNSRPVHKGCWSRPLLDEERIHYRKTAVDGFSAVINVAPSCHHHHHLFAQ